MIISEKMFDSGRKCLKISHYSYILLMVLKKKKKIVTYNIFFSRTSIKFKFLWNHAFGIIVNPVKICLANRLAKYISITGSSFIKINSISYILHALKIRLSIKTTFLMQNVKFYFIKFAIFGNLILLTYHKSLLFVPRRYPVD